MSKSIIIGGIAVAAMLAPFASAQAGQHEIEYNVNDLRSLENTRGAWRDIKRDAERICGAEGYADKRGLSQKECVDEVVDYAVKEIGDRRLSIINDSRMGR